MAGGTDKLRLFVAIHVPEEVKASLRRSQQDLKAQCGQNVRWTPPEQWHLTLLFLGYVPSTELPELEQTFAAVSQRGQPLSLQLSGLGCFPNERRPRVIWAGVAGDIERLKSFQKEVQTALQPWCEKEETRPYSPHLTLGRVREGARLPRLGGTLHAHAAAQFGGWTVESCSLMRSELSSQGSLYTELRLGRFGAGH